MQNFNEIRIQVINRFSHELIYFFILKIQNCGRSQSHTEQIVKSVSSADSHMDELLLSLDAEHTGVEETIHVKLQRKIEISA